MPNARDVRILCKFKLISEMMNHRFNCDCTVQGNQLIHVLVYPVKRASSFHELLLIHDWKDHLDFSDPRNTHIQLNMSPNNHKRGGFKLAYFGTSNPPLFGSSPAICAKQSFYTKIQNVERQGGVSSTTVRRDIPYDSIKQAQDLIMEITCLNWSHALLEMVYTFVDEWFPQGSGKSKAIDIPRMRFVCAALAIEQVQHGAEARCFLLEELISAKDGGSFRKYLNNTSAKPCGFKNAENIQRAEFLAFAQHVQYVKTKKRAYVADFQGRLNCTWNV